MKYLILIRKGLKISILITIIGILLVSSLSTGIGKQTSNNVNDSISYEGILRVYIVEPVSRWDNYDGEPYHFGFLDFAFNDVLSIEYLDTYTNSITWNANQAGFGDIQEDNIIVMAALFSPEINKGYSNPPMNYPFEAHYVDAAAAATPGNSASNLVTEESTHTVFVEEATAEWCPYCPAMADALYDVYESGNYSFYFTALITSDKQGNIVNQVAVDHLDKYNHYAYPTSYFDGGYKTLVGGYDNPETYAKKIKSSSHRDVHEVDFSISVEWLGNSNIKIDVSITNNEELFNQPPGIPTIIGPTSGKIGEEQSYQIQAEDPDNNKLYYYVDWGDETGIELVGPYTSGRSTTIKHNWSEKGTYSIKVMSRDIYDEKSEWASLEVSMPKYRNLNPFMGLLIRFMERFSFFNQLL